MLTSIEYITMPKVDLVLLLENLGARWALYSPDEAADSPQFPINMQP